MDTLEFLQTVLPEDGIKYLALIDPKTGKPAHKPYENLIDMAKAVEEYDAKPVQVYHACGAYKLSSSLTRATGYIFIGL
jgi:hypothetical protein